MVGELHKLCVGVRLFSGQQENGSGHELHEVKPSKEQGAAIDQKSGNHTMIWGSLQ